MSLMRVNTNVGALNALTALNSINNKLGIHQLRLATGKRVNSAADDAAGFTIANRFTARIQGLGSAISNISDATNMLTVAEGHLNNINDILALMKSKASQAASDSLGTTERAAILEELEQLNSQLDLETAQAQWSGSNVLGVDGGANSDITFQIGASTTSNDELTFNVAESVWSNATTTTFDSTGLNVVASSTSVDSASTSTLSTDYSAGSIGTTGSTSTGLTELGSGYYTLEVSSATASGPSTGTMTVTLTLRDSNGDAVRVSNNGVSGTDTSLSTTVTGTSAGTIDLGVGIQLTSLAGISTGAGESAIYGVTYTRGGNTVGSQSQAQSFMQQVDDAMDSVADALGYIGAMQNRLDYQETSLTVAKTNTEAARSRIMDADMAYEQLEATKLQILQQTAVAMLGQANAAPQAVLGLFG